MPNNDMIDIDDKYYEIVAAEMKRGEYRTGLQAKATANAMGDEEKSKALYIYYRAKQLFEEDKEPIERTAQSTNQDPNEASDLRKHYSEVSSESQKKTVRILLSLGAIMFLYWLTSSNSEEAAAQAIHKLRQQMEARLIEVPTVVGDLPQVRMDLVTEPYGPPTLNVVYTLTTVSEVSDINFPFLKSTWVSRTCKSQEAKSIFENGGTFHYSFYTIPGSYIGEFKINTETCKQY